MTAIQPPDLVAPQHEVQRLLGRCLLRLQQYERLMKAMIAAHSVFGTSESIARGVTVPSVDADRLTLGQLVGTLLGSYISKECDTHPDGTPNESSGPIGFSVKVGLDLPSEAYDTLKADLRELVSLRNALVHHFIDLHDLWTVDGCQRAQLVLVQSYEDIDRRFEQLLTFAGYMDEAKKQAAELVQSPMFANLMVNGIAPDGQIHWPIAGIVTALRQAVRKLSVDGWANLEAAADWVAEHQPEQTPQRYGCVRWRQVVHESGQFELRRFAHNGQFAAWIRERLPAAPASEPP
ncbi:OST-HTH/LOTUS domain-containing protein [Stenotrophomonas oahuensis]|uniref:OST-HTH/LOTUS domain-containing protein n=1 Tax=Stenotrophomonas oahuensis TaxID=3003271 RepID=A0ABY9YVF9_9GAMM|nr:OST-HTH/LOTUS domain-containing protein [Stenotrophomonas sp. A5586]WNH54179.1 OST-HTH/LOTUS domain-containing protein [Stenotrophomonas sp. A5586]